MTPVYIEVSAGVRYWEDATINGVNDDNGTLTPFKRGYDWCPVIRLADGQVMDWPQGTVADIHFKVCDDGEYWLLDESKQRIGKWGGYYVPNDFLCHGDTGHGDYIILKINAEGVIQKWEQPFVEWACECADEDKSQSRWKRLSATPSTKEQPAAQWAATSASDAIPSMQMAVPASPELQAQIEAMVLAAAPKKGGAA